MPYLIVPSHGEHIRVETADAAVDAMDRIDARREYAVLWGLREDGTLAEPITRTGLPPKRGAS